MSVRESRQTYQNNKDWVVLFEDADLRKRIFRYYLESVPTQSISLNIIKKEKIEIETKLNGIIY